MGGGGGGVMMGGGKGEPETVRVMSTETAEGRKRKTVSGSPLGNGREW